MLELVTNTEVPHIESVSAENVCDGKTPRTVVSVQSRQQVFRGKLREVLIVLDRFNENLPKSLVKVWKSQCCNLVNEQGLSVRAPERVESNIVCLFPYALHIFEKRRTRWENVCKEMGFSLNLLCAFIISCAHGILLIYKMNWCAAFNYSIVNVLYIFNILCHILWKWVLIRNPLPSHLYPTLCQRKWSFAQCCIALYNSG